MKNNEKEKIIVKGVFRRTKVFFPSEFKEIMKLVSDYEETLIFREAVNDPFHPKCRWAVEGGNEVLEKKLSRLEREITSKVIHLNDLCARCDAISKPFLNMFVTKSEYMMVSLIAEVSDLLDEMSDLCIFIRQQQADRR